jgi:hypothetical protein
MVEKNAVTPSPKPRGRRGHAARLFRGAARERIRRVAGCENFGGSAVTPEVFAACVSSQLLKCDVESDQRRRCDDGILKHDIIEPMFRERCIRLCRSLNPLALLVGSSSNSAIAGNGLTYYRAGPCSRSISRGISLRKSTFVSY